MNKLKYITVNDQNMKEIINKIVSDDKKYLQVNYPELQNDNEPELSKIIQAFVILSDTISECFDYPKIKIHFESLQRIIYSMYILMKAHKTD